LIVDENLEIWPELARVSTTNEPWAHLSTLDADEQTEAMRQWFGEHYEDPAERTPYESAEGGYIWIFGGPYDAHEELEAEFSGAVPDEVIAELAQELNDITPWWARSSDYDNDEDDSLWDAISSNANSQRTFTDAIATIREIMQMAPPSVAERIHPLLYANAITALEVYLADTFINKVVTDEESLRKFFEGMHGLTKKHVRLAAFPNRESAVSAAKTPLMKISWHNLRRAESLYRETLGIAFTEAVAALDAAVSIRHDIIHRNGKTKEGIAHRLGAQEVNDVISAADALVATVEREYNTNFPHVYEWPNGEPDF
jgi:hypothetical protein